MFRLAHTEYLHLLYIIPILIAVYWFIQKYNKTILEKFASSKLHSVLIPLKSKFKNLFKFILFLVALLLIIFTLANPQVGAKIEEVKQIGIDVYICLDVSASMQAEDIKPSRLIKAKHQISRLIQMLRGDRIGLIVFSGQAYVQFPLTTDYSAANLFLNAVDVSSVPQPGTAIAEAINIANKSFKKDESTEKAIIIITDGEDHEGNVEEAVSNAVNEGISVYVIGMGSPNGAPIPVKDRAGNIIGYKKDSSGETVVSKLNEDLLKSIASQGEGKYYQASNTENELDMIYRDLSKIEQSEYGSKRITEYEDRYYYLLFPAIFLLIIEIFISSKKSKLFSKLEEK
ncbi:MAG: VWA domain-containing protein [Ignavibacteriales bacterium]|nr:VWA domain-containing protein [Ignavibacteriales bacterium]